MMAGFVLSIFFFLTLKNQEDSTHMLNPLLSFLSQKVQSLRVQRCIEVHLPLPIQLQLIVIRVVSFELAALLLTLIYQVPASDSLTVWIVSSLSLDDKALQIDEGLLHKESHDKAENKSEHKPR